MVSLDIREVVPSLGAISDEKAQRSTRLRVQRAGEPSGGCERPAPMLPALVLTWRNG
jgi:hypothetical protein